MKRTYQPSKVRRARTHGFLVRMKTRGGQAVIKARRAKGQMTLPGTIGEELATNVFLRPESKEIRSALGMPMAGKADIFAEIRKRKDAFR